MTEKKTPLKDVSNLSPHEQLVLANTNLIAKRVQAQVEAAIKQDDLEQLAPGYIMSLAISMAMNAAEKALLAMKLEPNLCQRLDGVVAGMDGVINGGVDASPEVKAHMLGHASTHFRSFAHEKYGVMLPVSKAEAFAALGLPPGAQVEMMEITPENMDKLHGGQLPDDFQKFAEAKGKQNKVDAAKAKPKDASHLTPIDGGKTDPKKLH